MSLISAGSISLDSTFSKYFFTYEIVQVYFSVFWIQIRIHVFFGLPDPDPDLLVRGMDPIWIRILLSSYKK